MCLVKVKVASICGTDLHIYNWDRWAQNRIHPPLIPGHEFCGEVAAFGDEVTSVKEGDFVSAEMHVACGKCLQCRTGEAHICQNVKIIGVDADGAFAEYVVIPESNIWKLDPAIPQEYASILDPLGNAVHTVLAGEIAAKTVAVTGCGPIGLFSIAVARAVGATSVFAIELNDYRAKIAREMKADYVLNPAKEDVHAIIMEKTGGLGVDVVLEMAGHPDSIRTAFDIVRRGGRISLLGLTSKPISVNFSEDIIFKGMPEDADAVGRVNRWWDGSLTASGGEGDERAAAGRPPMPGGRGRPRSGTRPPGGHGESARCAAVRRTAAAGATSASRGRRPRRPDHRSGSRPGRRCACPSRYSFCRIGRGSPASRMIASVQRSKRLWPPVSTSVSRRERPKLMPRGVTGDDLRPQALLGDQAQPDRGVDRRSRSPIG